LDSPLIFLAEKSDLMGEMGDHRHPKTAQISDILLYIWEDAIVNHETPQRGMLRYFLILP
jgi:hypothetical protein